MCRKYLLFFFTLTTISVVFFPFALYPQHLKKEVIEMLNDIDKKELLHIARESLSYYLEHGKMKEFSVQSETLKEKMGAFVTLKNKGDLRGCIGYIVGVKPLYETIAEMAVNAGTRDTRFSPVSANELKEIKFEISALTPFKKIDSVDEIEVGKHGLYIKKGFYSGLLLPQVATEYGWKRDEFLEYVCFKAGLPKDAWTKNAEIFIFSAQVFGEE